MTPGSARHSNLRRMMIALVATAACTLAAGVDIARAHTASEASSRASALTQEFLTVGARYRTASARERPALETALITTAAQRRSVLTSLMESDPASVLALALPAGAAAGLPLTVAAYLEQKAQVEGVLEILHEDSSRGSQYRYFLHAAGARHSLHFATSPPDHLLTGATIRATGVQIGTTLALGGGKNVQQVKPAVVPNALGAQRTLVILVNFQDNPDQPYTAEDARNALLGTTSAFFLENSYEQTWLTGDFYGWFTIAVNSTTCDDDGVASAAKAAATAAGANLTAYTHLVYAFPQNVCGYWGRSTVGGNPSQTWINGAFQLPVLAHELGHSLGLWHSHSLDCGPDAVIGAACATNEYGDIVDMMGSSGSAHFSAFQKERLGWLNAGVAPPMTSVLSDGTYRLESYALAGSGPKALKILKSTDPSTGKRTWYYVESRQAIGFDTFLGSLANTTSNVLDGVLIHTGTEGNGNSSYLLDMTPATPVYYWWYDLALAVGQTFHDPAAGVTMTTEWVTATEAAVTVRLGATGTASSAVTVATSQSTYTLGDTVTVTARVMAGTSPVANAAVTFTITRPTGTVVSQAATTATDGTAVSTLRLRQRDPVGTYQAAAALSGPSDLATTQFTVK